jgi:hypothetical protein
MRDRLGTYGIIRVPRPRACGGTQVGAGFGPLTLLQNVQNPLRPPDKTDKTGRPVDQ